MDKKLATILTIIITCLVSSGTIVLKSCNDLNNTKPESVQIETQSNVEK